MGTKKIGVWSGGFIGKSNKGTITYYISKLRDGKQFTFSLKTDDKSIAEEHFKRFLANPYDFTINGSVTSPPLFLAKTLIEQYLDYSAGPRKQNSEKWRKNQQYYLEWWGDPKRLGKISLRALTLAHIKQHVSDTMPGVVKRLAILKAFLGWLRSEGTITREQDPMFGTIKVSDYAFKSLHRTAASPTQIRAIYEKLDEFYQPAFLLHLNTGWHVTELCRFAENGQIEGDVLVVLHKNGKTHKQRVQPAALTAAKKVRLRGYLSEKSYYKTIIRVSKELGIKFSPGAMRHSVITFAMSKGEEKRKIQRAVGHAEGSLMLDQIYDQNIGETFQTIL